MNAVKKTKRDKTKQQTLPEEISEDEFGGDITLEELSKIFEDDAEITRARREAALRKKYN